jgi:hypothetical protein
LKIFIKFSNPDPFYVNLLSYLECGTNIEHRVLRIRTHIVFHAEFAGTNYKRINTTTPPFTIKLRAVIVFPNTVEEVQIYCAIDVDTPTLVV